MTDSHCSTCCSPNEIFSGNSTCDPMDPGEKSSYFSNAAFAALIDNGLNVSEGNFEKASSENRGKCAKGYKIGPLLRPREKCNDRFSLQMTDTGKVSLFLHCLEGFV